MERKTEVLVVGAGPTGLTLAVLLCRSSIGCIVIDRAAAPSTTSKAIGLQYRVSEILSWMGLFERFLARAAQQTTVNLLVGGAPVARLVLGKLEPTSAGAFAPCPLAVPQSDTEELLGEALQGAGGVVEWNSELVDIEQDESGVVGVLACGQRIRARYLVSCEGAHSVARKREGIAFEGKTYPHDFIMADVAMDSPLCPGEAYSFIHPNGVLSAITMPGEHRWRLFIEADASLRDDVTLEVVRALYAERTGDRKSVISDPTWLTRFKIHARIVERFRSGRVFLAGDAAHLHSPSGGQGITTGMQDAANLAWKLAHVLRRGADVSLLDTYDEERRPAAAAVLKTTDRNTRLLFADGALAKWFRTRVFLPLLDTKFVQRRLLGKLSQLGDGYRGSSLSRTLPRSWQRGIVAGDRVPDVVLAGGTTLFGMLAEGRVIALFGNPDDELAARLNRLGIRTGLLAGTTQRIFGSSPDVWLIRPDGYVVCRCALKQSGALAPVLRRLFARAAVDAAFGPAQSLPIPLRRVAFAAVCIQFLALMRTLGEIVRLRSTITLNGAMPYIGAALFTSAMAWIAVGLLFSGRMRATTFVAAATVAGLVVIKAATL